MLDRAIRVPESSYRRETPSSSRVLLPTEVAFVDASLSTGICSSTVLLDFALALAIAHAPRTCRPKTSARRHAGSPVRSRGKHVSWPSYGFELLQAMLSMGKGLGIGSSAKVSTSGFRTELVPTHSRASRIAQYRAPYPRSVRSVLGLSLIHI